VDDVAEQRFWNKVDQSAGPHGCWLWMGCATATVWVDGRRRRAHRIAYEQATGEQLGDLVVVAKCRNSLCLNLSHLTAATKKQVQNRRDRPNRNNRNSGVRNVYRDRDRWRAQITADGVAIHIGTFHCIEDADAAVRKARACIAA
jgi:HNH endonuclease